MGGWKLEVGKMVLYMAFPVGLFHYFNQPQYFEEWVTKVKREMYPPESLGNGRLIEECITQMRVKHDLEMLRALENEESKS